MISAWSRPGVFARCSSSSKPLPRRCNSGSAAGVDDIRIEGEEDGARLFDPREGGLRHHQPQLIFCHAEARLERRRLWQAAAGRGEQPGCGRVGRRRAATGSASASFASPGMQISEQTSHDASAVEMCCRVRRLRPGQP